MQGTMLAVSEKTKLSQKHTASRSQEKVSGRMIDKAIRYIV